MLKPHVPPEPPTKSKRNQIEAFVGKNSKPLIVLVVCSLSWLTWRYYNHYGDSSPQPGTDSALIGWRSLSDSAQKSQLKQLAEEGTAGLSPEQRQDRFRARYLWAVELIERQQGEQALTYLQGLTDDYPLLRPQILFKTALAHQQNGQQPTARKILKELIEAYPQHPLTANALVILEENELLESRLIAEFPYHPLTQKMARQRLSQDEERFELLLLLAKYGREAQLDPIRDRLVLEYPARLTPQDWETIADGYWRSQEHRKAADAYTFASPTPRNLYRAARGFHRNGNLSTARRAYQRLIEEYHDAWEAGQALIHLASISSGDEAVVYLEKAIAKFPQSAPQAYLAKAIVHERFDKNQAAKDSRQQLLARYGNSAAAARYRWQTAQKLAAKGKTEDAMESMQPVVKSNREFDFAAKAIYQTGKWANEVGNAGAATTAFKQVIRQYPQTYWAWRSAVMLGWDVGDFEQLRSQSPSLELTSDYSPLPVGSPALQELYLLGQDRDAWLLFQSEIEQPQQLSVDEQFTEGVLLLELGNYSQGMQQIWELSERENPQEIEQWQALRKTDTYWHSLFPFPYQDQILQYARQEKINPLLVISVMRKESTFDPDIDSIVGAVGLMQLVPPTASWVAEQIQLADYSLTNPEDNIRLGSWYLSHNHHRYDNNSLLAIASYNAGTSNVNDWLNRFDINNRDRFVEQIPFPETKDYVEGVFGNYWNYLRLYNPEIRQKVQSLQQEEK